jgi:hypothetical protein
VTPITDLRPHRKDLVISTMGRGFWVLDDLSRLHQWKAVPTAPTLFAPREAVRARLATSVGSAKTPDYPGAVVHLDYALPTDAQAVAVAILDAAGKELRVFTSASSASPASTAQGMRAPARGRAPAVAPGRTRGMHRFNWDLRLAGLPTANNPDGGPAGPFVVPGSYTVRLTVDDKVAGTQPLRIRLDPRVVADGVTQADLEAQQHLLASLREAAGRALALSATLADIAKGADATKAKEAAVLRARLVTAGGNYPQPMLIDQLSNVWRMANQADQRPGRDAFVRLDDLRAELADLEKQTAALR